MTQEKRFTLQSSRILKTTVMSASFEHESTQNARIGEGNESIQAKNVRIGDENVRIGDENVRIETMDLWLKAKDAWIEYVKEQQAQAHYSSQKRNHILNIRP